MAEEKSGKQISITLNRDSVINIVLAVQLGLLLVFGWQLMQLKEVVGTPGTGSVKAANNGAPTAAAPSAQPSEPAAAGVVAAPTEEDHMRGDTSAKITLIEYSDFECPFCQRFHPTAQQAVDEYGGDVNWVYRHFPLSFHLTAEPKAVASECVARLAGNDAFWSFADSLFANPSSPVTEIPKLASSVGVDQTALQNCIDSGEYDADVQADLMSGQDAGVTGTPGTIVYNNETGESRLVSGAVPYAQLKAAIDALL